MKKLSFVLALCVLLPAATSDAKEYPHDPAGVTITIPNHWEVEEDDDLLMCSPKDESLIMMFMVLEADEIDVAVKELDKELSKFVKKVKMEEGEEIKINGMPAYIVDGKGVVEGKKVDVGVGIIATPKDKLVLVLALGEIGKHESHEAEVGAILQSLRPLKATKKVKVKAK